MNVMFSKRRNSSHVIGVKGIGLLPGLAGEPLLGEALVLRQTGITGVLASLRSRQRVLWREARQAITPLEAVAFLGLQEP